MADEKKNSTLAQEKAELDKTKTDARDEEILSQDELEAVAGGTSQLLCVRLDIDNPDRPRCQYG